MDKIDLCSLCCETYGKSIRPRGLSCGHSYCTDCLQKWIKNGRLSCPTCQKNHCVSDANEIAVNYDLEKVLSALRTMQQANLNSKPHPYIAGKKIEKLMSEQTSSAREQLVMAYDMKSQLSDYDKYLMDSVEEHEVIAQRLQALSLKHMAMSREMQEERKKITDIQKEIDSCTNLLESHLLSLETSFNTKVGAAAFVTKLVESVGELDERMESCQQQFPNQSFINSGEELLKVKDFLTDIDSQEDSKDQLARISSDICSIMEKVHMRSRKILSFPDIASNLQEGKWMHRISSGQVIAINSVNGHKRSANLSWKDGQVYLHSLRDEEEPSSPFRFEFNDVMNYLDRNEVVAFLDLSWESSFKGRVHILLSPDTPLARQFTILCTGELGPSYAQSRFHGVRYFQTNNEEIYGGDYEFNNGCGGKAVVDGLDGHDCIYKRKNERGIVWANYSDVTKLGAQFFIVTGSGSHEDYSAVFGKVQDGFSVLKDAIARMQTTKDVEISDCGVVLPL